MCTGCQTKSVDIFNRPLSDIFNLGSRKVKSAHWLTRPTQCVEIRCCCTGLGSCGLACCLPKGFSCSDWQCSHKNLTFSAPNLNFFVPRVMTLPLASFYMRTEIWVSSTFWKLIMCSNATSGHRLYSLLQRVWDCDGYVGISFDYKWKWRLLIDVCCRFEEIAIMMSSI